MPRPIHGGAAQYDEVRIGYGTYAEAIARPEHQQPVGAEAIPRDLDIAGDGVDSIGLGFGVER